MGKTITIACQGAATLTLEDLADFQGDLKRLSDDNYLKLRKQILDLGFSEPFSVWKQGRKRYILNGHQRRVTLLRMQAEGYTIPKLPVSWVKAKSLKQAKQKVLSLTSQYGEMTEEGLTEYAEAADLDLAQIAGDFRFPEVDLGFDIDDADMPALKHGDRPGFQQMTFILADAQAEAVKEALARAKAHGPFNEDVNANGNGNALARIAEAYHGDRESDPDQSDPLEGREPADAEAALQR